jgi:hypothetical protein
MKERHGILWNFMECPGKGKASEGKERKLMARKVKGK